MATAPAPDPFKPAVREALKLRLALYGPSKSGKTMAALLIARGLVGETGKVCVLDTENGSSRMYADEIPGGYNVLGMGAPYAPARFVQGINTAVQHGYDVVIIDGVSPAWNGPGGVQEIVDANTKGENKFSGWAVGSPEHQKLVQAILACPIHIIVTMRSATEWVVENGKPRKIGTKPVQRDGIDYEFTFVGAVQAESHLINLEARGTFAGRTLGAAEDWRQELVEFGVESALWLGSGEKITPAGTPQPASAPAAATEKPQEPTPASPQGFALPANGAVPGEGGDGATVEQRIARMEGWCSRFEAAKHNDNWGTVLIGWSETAYGKQPLDLSDAEFAAFEEQLEATELSIKAAK
jgi:hypothetical protein